MSWQNGMTLEDVEREAIEIAFSFFHGNKVQTAGSLDISVRTLDAKLEKYAEDKRVRDERNKKEIEAARLLQTQRRNVVVPPVEGKPEERTVPVRVGEEVQKVPPKPSVPSSPHKRGSEHQRR